MLRIITRITAIVIIAMILAYMIIPFPFKEKVKTSRNIVFQNEYGKILVWNQDTISEVFDKKLRPNSDSMLLYTDSAYYYRDSMKVSDTASAMRCINKAKFYEKRTDSLDEKYQFSELVRLYKRTKLRSHNLLTL